MKIILANSPWYKKQGQNNFYFVRAGSRWPHFEKFNSDGSICYMPFPFFMAYSSSLLKKENFDVLAIDGAAELLTESAFLDKIVKFQPELVMFEVSTVSIKKDLKDAEYIKQKTNAKIIFSGLHSFMYNSAFLEENPVVDFVLIAEYEYTLLELCNCLRAKKSLEQLKGIIFRKDEKIINSGRADLIKDLSQMPFPDRESFPIRNYLDIPGDMDRPSVQLLSSRGCPFGCIFCAWPQIIYGGNKFRQRNIENVVEEVKYLIKNYDVKSIYFDDDTFNVDKKFVQSFSKKIIEENIEIQWAAMCRADIMDEDTLLLMIKSGLKAIKYGVESSSETVLKNIDKSLDLEKVINTINFTKRHNVKIHLTFCFGLPGETKESVEESIELACKLNPDTIQFSIATPFPGSRYYNMMKKENKILTFDYSKYDGYNKCVIQPDNMETEFLEKSVKRAYKKFKLNKLKNRAAKSFIEHNEKIIFTGLTDFNKPYTRVRCYNFSKFLNLQGMKTRVYSYQEKLFPSKTSEEMLFLSEKERIIAMIKSFVQLAGELDEYLYLQKIHYHAAAPYLLRKLKLKKLILDYDDYDFDRSPMFKSSFLNKMVFGSNDAFKITEKIAKVSEACIVSSNYLKNIFEKWNENTVYIPTGVDISKFKIFRCDSSILIKDKLTFLWNGMVWGKVMYDNVAFLIDCFSELNKKFSNIELKIAGDGGMMPELEKLVKSSYNNPNIKFLGYISPDKMPDLLNSSDVGLLPLIPDEENKEWMLSKSPTKLFEYFACGLPTVAHNFGEVKYIIEDGVNGLLANNKKEFLNGMQTFIENNELRNQISKNAFEKCRNNYSMDILIDKLKNTLLKIVSKGL